MFSLLEELKFKESFIRWVQTLYKNANGKVINYGWISKEFSIHRGVRQGCPLSALLFIIVAEILTAKIKQNSKIKGIQVPNPDLDTPRFIDIRITQFADDTTIFVDSVDSVKEVMKVVETFGENAGPKINWSKSKFMKLNIDAKNTDEFNFTEDAIKCLGVYVGKCQKEVENLNWEGKVGKIKHTLDLWKMRRLTLYGKVTVIKHLVTSQLVYTATAVPVPIKIIKLVNKLVYSFLWNSKCEKVKRTVCYNSETEGGLKMVDLFSKCQSLRLSWIKKYMSGEKMSWKFLFKYWTMKIGNMPLCLRFNCNKRDMLRMGKRKKLPVFYLDLFCSWSEIRHIKMFNVQDVNNEVIWFNSNIRYDNEMLHFKSWVNERNLTVKQVIESGKWKDIQCIKPSSHIN